MKASVSIPILGSISARQNVRVNFPAECVFCGGRAETQVTVDLHCSGQAGGKKVEYTMKLNLPYCHEHAALGAHYRKKYERVMAIIAIAVILTAVVGWNISGMPSTSFLLPVALGAAAIALAHRIVVSAYPNFREIPALFQEGALGVAIRLNVTGSAATRLDFRFSNADYAAKFAQLNDATTCPA